MNGTRRIFIGSVIFHPTSVNPYNREAENPYRIGNERVEALKVFRDTGVLPEGFSLWCDGSYSTGKGPITSPDQVDWSGMRD